MTETMSRYRKRIGVMQDYLGGLCAHCGIDNDEALEMQEGKRLQFDHIVPRHKSFDISSFWAYSWERLVGELNKCQLLCAECHKEKTLADKSAMVPPTVAELEEGLIELLPEYDPEGCCKEITVDPDTEMSTNEDWDPATAETVSGYALVALLLASVKDALERSASELAYVDELLTIVEEIQNEA